MQTTFSSEGCLVGMLKSRYERTHDLALRKVLFVLKHPFVISNMTITIIAIIEFEVSEKSLVNYLESLNDMQFDKEAGNTQPSV